MEFFTLITPLLITLCIIIGFIGIIIPILPGVLLIWVGMLLHVLAFGFTTFTPFLFGLTTIIALTTGTADLWMSYVGAKQGGASKRAMLFGTIGALLGTFFLPIPIIGTVIGYAAGLLLGEYQKHQDWNLATKAAMGGLAGWTISNLIQLAGGILILIIYATIIF